MVFLLTDYGQIFSLLSLSSLFKNLINIYTIHIAFPICAIVNLVAELFVHTMPTR